MKNMRKHIMYALMFFCLSVLCAFRIVDLTFALSNPVTLAVSALNPPSSYTFAFNLFFTHTSHLQ